MRPAISHTFASRAKSRKKSCKRKILMCAGQEAVLHLAKKKKNTEYENPVSKENEARNNVIIVKSPYKNVKKHVDAAAVEFMVNAMKVVQLRKELRSRGLDPSGVKKDLRSRLVNAMLHEAENGVLQEASSMNHIPEVEEIQQLSPVKEKMQQQQQRKEDTGVEKKEVEGIDMTTDDSSNAANKAPVSEATVYTTTQPDPESAPEPLGPSTTSQESSKASATPGARKVSAEMGGGHSAKSYWKNLVKASPANTDRKLKLAEEKAEEGASKRSKSPLRALAKNAFKSHLASPVPTTTAKEGIDDFEVDPAKGEYLEEDEVSPPSSEVSEGSKVLGSKVRDMVSKISGSSPFVPSTTPGVNASASALSKTVQAKKEARMIKLEENRKARLEEMRNKVSSPSSFGI
jgi:hypothetical protein